MYTNEIVCKCTEIVMKSANGTTKIRSRVILVKNQDVYAVCKGCGTEVLLPLQEKPQSNPPLVVTR